MTDTQAKSLFMAQYLGQKLYYHNSWGKFKTPVEFGNPNSISHIENGYLLLRSVNQLTDEEKIMLLKLQLTDEVLKTIAIKKFYHYKDTPCLQYKFLQTKKEIDFEPNWYHSEIALFDGGAYENASPAQFQAMLRIGVLLPFTYIDEAGQPITLQPEEIVERGWVKINNL
jgi:hypothetical protein